MTYTYNRTCFLLIERIKLNILKTYARDIDAVTCMYICRRLETSISYIKSKGKIATSWQSTVGGFFCEKMTFGKVRANIFRHPGWLEASLVHR
jgi:hypothetical protein